MTEQERLDDAIEELYAVDLDQFTARRGELAKAAKADGDKDAAKAITALRKPTQSAFTINRLARTDPSSITALVDVGGEMRRAQQSADGPQLRALNSQRRTLLDSLTRRAFEIIGQQSPSSGQREEVSATLMAALADPAVAEQLQQGILVRAAESSGFGFSAPELTLIRSPARTSTVSDGAAETMTAPAATTKAAAAAATKADPATRARGMSGAESDADQQRIARAETAAAARRSRAAAEEERRQAARQAAVAAASAESDAADTAVHQAVAAIEDSRQLIRQLQRQLTEAKKALEDNQQRAKAAEVRQRKAREALNKASG